MPSRRRFAFLPLLATLAAFLLPSSSAWAQSVSFPFFGGGEGNAITSILTAFNYQWKFFGAMAGTAGGTANALYYMAITATLVGAILIVVNKKYQDPVTIGTWFVLVLVMVFAPYNSQLLFYPLNTVQNANNGAIGGGTPVASSGGACTPGSSDNICGFTPQVVAAHLGSTLALMIYDVFQKDGLQSLSQQINAQNAFHNDPSMQAKDIKPKWDEYIGRCGKESPTPPVVPAAMNGGAINNNSGTPSTIPFSDALRSISKNMRSSDHSAPIAIAIPKFNSEAEAGGGDKWGRYINGVNALRRQILGQTNAVTDGNYSAAVDEIVKAIASQPQASSNPMLNLSSYITAAPGGGGTLQHNDPTMQARTQFFVNKNGVQSDYGEQLGDSTKQDKINKGSARFLSTLAGDADIASMPVEQVVYDVNRTSCPTDCPVNATNLTLNLGACLRQSVKAIGGTCTGTIAATVGAKDDCVAKADILFKEAIKGMAANNYADYQPLLDQLNDTSTPNFSPTLTATDICKSLADPSQPCSNAQNILTYIKQNGDAANKASFAVALGNNIIRNSRNGGTPGTDTSSTSTNDPTGNSPLARAWNGVKQYLSGGIADLGLALAGGIGYFIGNVMGNAILAIVKVLAQVALMGIIIMTPFIFIMGLLVPSNAAGMLIVTTLSVFVLKFYPATIAIIDYTIGTINSAQWAANGSGLMGISLQGLLMLVQGILAAKVLSLTFWIMFKMGDTNNLRAITNLESAAGEIADAGAAAMAAVAAVAGTAVVGGAAAAWQGKSVAGGVAKAAGGKMLNTAKGMAGKAGVDMPTAAEAKGDVPEEGEQQGEHMKAFRESLTPDEALEQAQRQQAREAVDEDRLKQKKAEEINRLIDGSEEPGKSGGALGDVIPGESEDERWIGAIIGNGKGPTDGSPGDTPGEGGPADGGPVGPGSGPVSPVAPSGSGGGAVTAGSIEAAAATGGQINAQNVTVQSAAASTAEAATKEGAAAGGAGAPPSSGLAAPSSSASPVGGGDMRVGKMDVENANMPANAAAQQQDTIIKPNADEAEWLSKSRGERFLRGMWSGAVGSIAASGQLSKVPGVGQLMRVAGEIANEGTEAPIRAQAFWKAGKARKNEGYSGLSYWKAMKDQSALRMYQQREGVLAGAAAYNTLKDNGHLMSGWDNASNAAIQVAARQMSDQVKRSVHEANFGKMTADKYFTSNMVSSLSPDLGVEYANFQFKQGSFNAAEIAPVLKVEDLSKANLDTRKVDIIKDNGGKITAILHNDGPLKGQQVYQTTAEHTGLESVTFLQRRAALEASVDAPMNLQKINSLHERKLWDRRNDIAKANKYVEDYKAGKIKPEDYDPSVAHFAGMNEAEAFVADEMHHFKPQQIRNHREKAYIFIAQKVAESKLRGVEASYDGIQQIMDGWKHDVARRTVEVSADGRAAAQLTSDMQVKARKLEVSEQGRLATHVQHDIHLRQKEQDISNDSLKAIAESAEQSMERRKLEVSEQGRRATQVQHEIQLKQREQDISQDSLEAMKESAEQSRKRRKLEISSAGRRAAKLESDLQIRLKKREISDKGYKLAFQEAEQRLRDKYGETSDIGRAVARQDYKLKRELRKFRVTDLGMQDAVSEAVEKAGGQTYNAMASLGMNAQKAMSIYYNGARVSLDNAALVMTRELTGKGVSISETGKLLSKIAIEGRDNKDLIKSQKAKPANEGGKAEDNMQLMHKDVLTLVNRELEKTNLTAQERKAAAAMKELLEASQKTDDGNFFIMEKIRP